MSLNQLVWNRISIEDQRIIIDADAGLYGNFFGTWFEGSRSLLKFLQNGMTIDRDSPFFVRLNQAFKDVARSSTQDIEDISSTIVLYYAPRCPYSQRLLPIWDELAKKYGTRMRKVSKQECEKQQIMVFPTVKRFFDGECTKVLVGYVDAETLEELLTDDAVNVLRGSVELETVKVTCNEILIDDEYGSFLVPTGTH